MRKITGFTMCLFFFLFNLCFAGKNFQIFSISYILRFKKPIKNVKIKIPFPPELPEQRLLSYRIIPPEVKAILVYNSKYGSPVLWLKNIKTKKVVVTYQIKRYTIKTSFKTYRFYNFKTANIQNFIFKNYPLSLKAGLKKLVKDAGADSGDVLKKVKKLYNFVIEYMTYAHCKKCGDADLKRILKERVGNCVDYHRFFMALCGIAKIPTKFEIGYKIPSEKKEGIIKGYHSWVKVFITGIGWIPLDISEADKHPDLKNFYFGNLDFNRVCLSIGKKFVYPVVMQNEKVLHNYDLKVLFKKL